MSQYCDHLDVSFCERDSFEAIFDDAPDYVGFAQAVTSTRILGYFSTVEALTEAVPHPNIGDTYGIGEEAPYNLYVYSANGWIDNGVPDGPPGPPGPQGNDGAQGPPGPAAAVTAWEVKYQASASGTTTPTGTWSENIPEVPDGQFLWTRTEVTYSDGTTTTSYSVVRGVRGVGLLNITTEPSSYTTVTGGFTPAYRIALSTVKSQSRATEVLVGDTLHYSYYTYPVGYVDASYVYTDVRVSIRGADGNDGAQGPPGPQGNDGKDGSDAEVTAENIAAALGYTPAMVNPNLLDNWYFGNPVNQRGKSEYSGNIYGIDRWQAVSAHNMAITADGLKITISSSATVNICLKQAIERFKDLAGKTVTISAVVVENTCNDPLQFRLNSVAAGNLSAGSTGLMTATYTIPTNITELYIGFQTANRVNNDGSYFVIKAMKLELGTQQTLAHQENGVWVLNEIPDYGEQLRRCQRYCYVVDWSSVKYVGLYGYSHSDTEIRMFMSVPVPMRATPVLSNTNGNNWSVRGAEGTITIDNISAWFASTNGVIGLKFISSNLTTSTVYVATYSVKDALIFSADL